MTKNRRRRIIIQSVVVALVLTTAWIGVLVGLQMLKSSTYRFRAETENVMVSIRDGLDERALDCIGIPALALGVALLLRPFQDVPFVDDWSTPDPLSCCSTKADCSFLSLPPASIPCRCYGVRYSAGEFTVAKDQYVRLNAG